MTPATTARDLPGIGTLFGLPHGRVDDLSPGDYAILGVPYDLSSPGLVGSRHGPRACRAASAYYGVFAPSFEEITTARVLDFPPAIDLGDIPLKPLDWDASHDILGNAVRAVLAAGARPVMIGGDHFVTSALVAGFAAEMMTRGGGPVGYVQFSRRLDLAEEHPAPGAAYRGSTARRIAAAAGMKLATMAWVGTHGYQPAADVEFARARNLHVLALDGVRRDGIAASTRRALELTGADPARTYISIDLDVLDGGYISQTDEPAFDGLTNVQLLEAIDVLNEIGVGALDVTGLNPSVEETTITGARFTAWLILRYICHQRPLSDGGAR